MMYATYISFMTDDKTGDMYKHHGGFAGEIVTPSEFLIKVPKNYPLEYFGPLNCAGVTTYTALKNNGASVGGKNVVVAGVGGLGHLAIQYSNAFNNHTIAVDLFADKHDLALELGAKEFVKSDDKAGLKGLMSSVDLVLITIPSAKFRLRPYINMLKKGGTIVFIGLSTKTLDEVIVQELVLKNINIKSSLVGSIHDCRECVQFSADNKIYPMVEVFNHSDAQEVVEKVEKNQVRFRAVLKNNLPYKANV